jgi:hypothetical protein
MLRANKPGTPLTGVGSEPSLVSSTSSRLEAGSVLTIRTCFPAAANARPQAQESEVLPTPPLPVKKA